MADAVKRYLRGGMGYRGGESQWSHLLHRLSGLGTLAFLVVHILDTSTVYFFPSLYEHAIALYRTTPFMLAEIGLVFMVLFHGVNGLRLALFDLFPEFWHSRFQRPSLRWTVVATLVLWLPAAYLMGRHLVENNF